MAFFPNGDQHEDCALSIKFITIAYLVDLENCAVVVIFRLVYAIKKDELHGGIVIVMWCKSLHNLIVGNHKEENPISCAKNAEQ